MKLHNPPPFNIAKYYYSQKDKQQLSSQEDSVIQECFGGGSDKGQGMEGLG